MELYISIAALVVSVVSVVISLVTYFVGLRREKRQATLDAFNVLQQQVLDKLNSFTKTEVTEIAEDHKSEQYKKLSVLLARCEHFAVGVNTRIYDMGTVKRLAGLHMLSLYEKMEPLIEKKRELNKTERHYDDLEKLTNSIKKLYQKRRK